MVRGVAIFLLAVVIYSACAFPQGSFSQECGPNEVFNSCGSACVPSCAVPNPGICTMQCKIGCECNEGYMRNSRNECVLQRDCS